ncbi:hypothetical protein Mapa_005834 [Marchantia paleacea]|nr:hypothetical protein Mapa_005834 [Marchantia paleacea]
MGFTLSRFLSRIMPLVTISQSKSLCVPSSFPQPREKTYRDLSAKHHKSKPNSFG